MNAIVDYMHSHGLTQAEFAELCGVTQGAVSQWLNGVVHISYESALAIERATGGAIRVAALRPDLISRRDRK